jgi:glycosyltransferase involved in cell wall biosynthesis
MNRDIKVTFYHRRPFATNYSIERVFHDVRNALPKTIQAEVIISRFTSQGFLKRLYNICEAPFYQGDVNHITGDVHYLTYLLKRKRTLLTIHDCVSLDRLTGWRKAALFFFWYWLPAKNCQLITVISEATRQELLKYLPWVASKVRVVHNPVSPDFQPDLKTFSVSPKILQVGTGPNKNLTRLAAALKGIDCHLRIVGRLSPDQLSSLDDNVIDYSVVVNISDSQLVREYRDADMVVFASTYEGFGLPILEAQATGRPVVTSNIMPMPEVAADAAYLVNPYNVLSIRTGILRVIEDRVYREELIYKGLQNVKRFSPEAIAQQYVAIYYEMVGN